MAVLGVDGCPGGWVAARVEDGALTWHVGDAASLLALDAHVVGIDIPIGLPAGADRRAADVAARQALGPARSSVFFAPPRVVLAATSQPEASRLARAAGSVGVSIQMFHLLAKVAEVDDLLRADRRLAQRVVEVHPELSLQRLGAGAALPPKRTAAGRQARLAVLSRWLPALALPARLPGRARPDDCLDAVAAAWSAARWRSGEAEVFGGGRDGFGLPMRIVV